MMRRAALVVLLLLTAGAAAAACGDDGDGGPALTAVQYFERLEAAIHDSAEDFETAVAVTPSGEGPETTEDAAEAFIAIGEDFLERVEGLVPPEELRDLHEEFVESLSDEVSESADTDIFAVFETAGPELATALERADRGLDRAERACNALENAAFERGLDVELCGGEEE